MVVSQRAAHLRQRLIAENEDDVEMLPGFGEIAHTSHAVEVRDDDGGR